MIKKTKNENLKISKSPGLPVVLVAGGAGFIGSHLCEYLLKKDFLIVAVDDLSTGKKTFITPLLSHPRFLFLNFDLNKGLPENIESVDYIFHLASMEEHLELPKKVALNALETAAFTTKNLLELARTSQAKILLASSVEVYQGVLSSMHLQRFFGSNLEEEKHFSFLEAKRFAESLVWEYFQRFSSNVRIARLPYIYGPRMNFDACGSLGKFLKEALESQTISIFGEGLDQEYCNYIDDIILGLEKALFNPNTKGKIFPLATLEPITILELAYLVKNAFSPLEIQINFLPAIDKIEMPDLRIIDGQLQENLDWSPAISLKQGLKQTINYLSETKAVNLPVQTNKQSVKKEQLTTDQKSDVPLVQPSQLKKAILAKLPKPICLRKQVLPKLKLPKIIPRFSISKTALIKFSIIASLVLTLVCYPAIKTFFNLKNGVNHLLSAKKSFIEANFQESYELSEKAHQELVSVQKNLSILAVINDKHRRLLSASILANEAINKASQPMLKLKQAFIKTFNFESMPVILNNEEITSIENDLSFAKENLLFLQAEIKNFEKPIRIFNKEIPLPTEQELNNYLEKIDIFQSTVKSLPEFLGFQGTKRYLILFQNQNELRANGGFIGSYGKLSFENGKLVEFKIDDIYNPDGQLDQKGIAAEPPQALKDNIGVVNLRIHDANWEIDFADSAKNILDLFDQATEEKFDAIIAVNLNLIERLLELTGPLYLAQYQEAINSNNIFERATFHSEQDFFPGSTQKKNFLSLVAQKIFDELAQLPQEKTKNLLSVINNALDEKDILLHFPNMKITSLLEEKLWTGKIKSVPNSDYLMIVDSNVGANKANFWLERSISYQIKPSTRQEKTESELILLYHHKGTSNSWPGGSYKNFLRIVTPLNTELQDVLVRGQNMTDQVKLDQKHNKNIFSLLVEVEPGETVPVVVHYFLPEKLFEENMYKLFVQKQPGTKQDKLNVSYVIPFGKNVTSTSGGGSKTEELVLFEADLKKDVEFEVGLK